MKIWANTIINNEENFLWFSVMSVADYVDKILIYDTGSTDKTTLVIEQLIKKLGNKVEFKEVGKVNPEQFTKMRQKMLQESDCDWILILDGDEIWWKSSIKKLTDEIKKRGKNIEGIVVPMVVPAGDIYHHQADNAGRYQILGKKGHISLKAFSKKIPGLHADWPYGKEGFFDKEGVKIQDRKKNIYIGAPFLHTTHLRRSNSRREYDKFKYELGTKVKRDFKFPEVLNGDYPQFIKSPWTKISGGSLLLSKVLTPLRKVKRKIYE